MVNIKLFDINKNYNLSTLKKFANNISLQLVYQWEKFLRALRNIRDVVSKNGVRCSIKCQLIL